MIGQKLSHFEILDHIGIGGMGVVYKARDLRLRRTVALKVLTEWSSEAPETRARFLREARTASALNHRHIVTIHEVDSAEGRDLIVMELVEGESLETLIGNSGLPLERALDLATQIADALAYAHRQGVVHRDLKPQNVMVRGSDEVKVLDFGLAKRLPTAELGGGETLFTTPGTLLGTPAYMSPEQIAGEPVDGRSDVFAFGTLLYEMLTGRVPFQADGPVEVMSAIIKGRFPPLSRERDELPPRLEAIVARALAVDRDERFESMDEVRDALQGVADGGRGNATARRLRRLRRFGPVAAVVAVAGGLGAWLGVDHATRPATWEVHTLRPLSALPTDARQPSLAPDGRRIAYIADGDDARPRLWIADLEGSLAPVSLAGDAGVPARPAWHPDGGRLVFEIENDGIWSVGAPLQGAGNLAEATDNNPVRLLGRGRSPSFSADGSTLLFERDGLLWLAGAHGERPRPLAISGRDTSPTSGLGTRRLDPARSPDGERIVYIEPAAGGGSELWLVSADDGQPERLIEAPFVGGGPAFSNDGDWLIFSADFGTGRDLWRVPAGGGDAEALLAKAGDDVEPVLAGGRLAYSRAHHEHALVRSRGDDTDVLRSSPREIAGEAVAVVERGILDPRGQRQVSTRYAGGRAVATLVEDSISGETWHLARALGRPRWSPDGELIAGEDGDRIVVCAASGAICRDLGGGHLPRWPPDETTWLAGVRRAGDGAESDALEVVRLSLSGEPNEEPLARLRQVDPEAFDYSVEADGAVVWLRRTYTPRGIWLAELSPSRH